jgi:hypothetical protein
MLRRVMATFHNASYTNRPRVKNAWQLQREQHRARHSNDSDHVDHILRGHREPRSGRSQRHKRSTGRRKAG